MPRNVEIKAIVANLSRIRELAANLCDCQPDILRQEDIFYKVSQGRLKLRSFEGGATSQLIFYNRPDTEGPKLSDYSICPVPDPESLNAVLTASLGVVGRVKKTRYLYIYGQTRIHLDDVQDLGTYAELEVVLTPDQTLEQGQDIADQLMRKLEIKPEDLVSGAYLDHLLKQ